jgi:hypothetical protein
MIPVRGESQSGEVGKTVAVLPSVEVLDGNGNPVAGIEVEYETTGGGTIFSRDRAAGRPKEVWAFGIHRHHRRQHRGFFLPRPLRCDNRCVRRGVEREPAKLIPDPLEVLPNSVLHDLRPVADATEVRVNPATYAQSRDY